MNRNKPINTMIPKKCCLLKFYFLLLFFFQLPFASNLVKNVNETCSPVIGMESDTFSSSSDEEANERFKAAAAEELISVMKNPDSGETLRASECSKAATKEAKKSIRDQIFCETAMQDTVANTTPEFRAHVAKKLMKYFDGILVNKSASLKEVKTVNLDPGGVKLLSNSSQFVSFSNEIPRTVKPSVSKRSPDISSSDSEDDCKFASVAVSGNDILQNGEGAFKR